MSSIQRYSPEMLVLVWLCLGLVLVQGQEDCAEVNKQFTQCTRE